MRAFGKAILVLVPSLWTRDSLEIRLVSSLIWQFESTKFDLVV